MSTIRKQSIVSSFVVYLGFALGFFNTYLMTRKGGFTKEQYGITAVFFSVAQLMYAISNVGMTAVVAKFYPYYKAHLPKEKNDLLSIALTVSGLGFLLMLIFGIAGKGIIVNRIFKNSPELLQYYYWIFPFGLGYTFFMLLDIYAWQLRKAILSNFLKEILFRFFTTILLGLVAFHFITQFDLFVKFYAFGYLALAIFLVLYLRRQNHFHLTYQISNVSRKFRRKIIALVSFVWGGGLIVGLASVVDTLFITAILPNGVGVAGVFTFGQYIASLVQAPQRAVIAATTGPLSQAWKDKNFKKLNKIYHRSSINQLLFSCAMFSLIWINFEDAINTFHLQTVFLQAKWVFFFFGITKIIDMGTGVNSQIIGTSTYWRFEFVTGLILLAVMMILNFFLTRSLGMLGPAISNLVSFTVYNTIRYFFLLRKFGMQPFDQKTVYSVLLAACCFLLSYLPFKSFNGLQWMVLRSLVFCVPFATVMVWQKLSPDAIPVWQTVKNKLRIG